MFLYKYLSVIYANCFNLCHCRHSTKCRAEGGSGRIDRSARSTRSAMRSRRPPPMTTRRSSWWSRRPVGGGSGRRTSTRRLQFEEAPQGGTTTTTTGDGGSDDDSDDDGGEPTLGEMASSGLSKPYQRGPSSLPEPRPLPSRRPVIRPVGQT